MRRETCPQIDQNINFATPAAKNNTTNSIGNGEWREATRKNRYTVGRGYAKGLLKSGNRET
jgi:hypothetical protein